MSLASDFQAAWTCGIVETFEIFAQSVIWNKKSYQAVVDALPYSDTQRSQGGGFVEEFMGNIVFLKSDFPSAIPQVGDDIQVGKRLIRITEVANAGDVSDPTIHCIYRAKAS